MAAAFGTLANDGLRIAPHLVREVRAGDGTIVYSAAPEERRVVSAETARTLRGMLEEVTLNGTAKLAQLDGYTAAGKTGTAQKIRPEDEGLLEDEVHRLVRRLRARRESCGRHHRGD